MTILDGTQRIEETDDDHESETDMNTHELDQCININIPCSPTKQLDQSGRVPRILDFLKSTPSAGWFKNLRFPFLLRQAVGEEGEEISLTASPSLNFDIAFVRATNWASIANICKEWLQHPMNVALLIWLTCVAVSATMLGLLLLGLLDRAFPTKSLRNHWVEFNNQILNALFTLMSLYQHPNLFHHLVLLCRWRKEDVTELRRTYCKNGSDRPHEWTHLVLVIALLHLTCFAQYALCSLYWLYSISDRPAFAENSLAVLGTAAPVIAGAYTVYSPLGREYDSDRNEEESPSRASVELKDFSSRVMVSQPEWAGGLFDCGGDVAVGGLSFFCTFCVFGWNMERLGFGNMYVHVVTFLLLCIAPFWMFNMAALRINDVVVGDMVGTAGIVLCVFGLVYGGFWRIQMRRRFKLPESTFCCGSASMTDYAQWMFCWPCSLAQEVRTGNLYEVEEDSVYRKRSGGGGGDEDCRPLLRPLPREGGLSRSMMTLDCSGPSLEEGSRLADDDAMTAPMQPWVLVGGADRL